MNTSNIEIRCYSLNVFSHNLKLVDSMSLSGTLIFITFKSKFVTLVKRTNNKNIQKKKKKRIGLKVIILVR